jgi:uncharacterized protein (TIRG00374 family)
MSRPWFVVLAKMTVTGALLGLLLLRLNVHEVVANLRHLTPLVLLFAWGYYSGCQLLSAYRWQFFLTAKGIQVPLQTLFSFYMVGMFLNNFLPGAVGGDVVKSYHLYRYTRQGQYAVLSVFLERFMGLVGLSILSVVALAIWFQHLQSFAVLTVVGGTALFLTTGVLFFWWPPLSGTVLRAVAALLPARIAGKVQSLHAALASYRDHRQTLAITVVLSVAIQVLYACYFALISRALGIPISVHYFLLFLPLVTLVTTIPISIGGLGVREALMIWLFGEVGVAPADVLAVSLTVYLLGTLLSLVGGVLLLLQSPVPMATGGKHHE